MSRILQTNIRQMELTDHFWKKYIEVVRNQVIPYQWKALNDELEDTEPSHAIKNFKIAAGEEEGEFYGMVFQDSDVAKWLEAVAYSLEVDPDPTLEKTADEVIDLLERAQQEDGYLNTYFTIKEPENRWGSLMHNHELYCAGHFIEAAVAYYHATGKRKFLDIMCRFADHIYETFGKEEGKLKGYPGHQEIELALVKLYRTTGDKKYLDLSKFFIDERGQTPHYFDIEREKNAPGVFEHMTEWFDNFFEYNQSHKPVREQTKAIGHSVRAVYMYSAMADLAYETEDASLKEAVERLWENVTQRQMYVTGGIGSTVHGEAFSFDYDLPNDLCYTETCASIGLVFWAKRMLQLEKRGEYADVLERALYNGTISGMELDGTKFFYVNPLEVHPESCDKRREKGHVRYERQKWFSCACCPPNLARLIASIGHYIYSIEKDTAYIHLYIGNDTTIRVKDQEVDLRMETHYPWDENIKITVHPMQEEKFTIALRIPGWCQNAVIKVNGKEYDIHSLQNNGYAYIERFWKKGDVIELILPLSIKRIKSNPNVRANVGKVALQRGPVVYCLEEVDNGRNLPSIFLPKDSQIRATYDESLLNGVVKVTGEALKVKENKNKDLYYAEDIEFEKITFKAIPYYAWCNRDKGEMIVWINEK